MLYRKRVRLFKKRKIIDEFANVNVKLTRLCKEKGCKTIMVSGCHRKAGTSTVAVNLSRALAEQAEGRILLVDANLYRPSLARAFGSRGALGLLDLVADGADLEDVFEETRVNNLSLLPAGGRAASHPFSPDKIARLLRGWKDVFDFVVIDSAPVSHNPDSLALAAEVDLVLMVFEAGKTRWEVARETIQRLSRVGVKTLEVVLNKRRQPVPSFLYDRF